MSNNFGRNEGALKTIMGSLGIIVFFISGLAVWGWVWNIIKLAGSSFDPLHGLVVLRCIGVIVAPLGAVMGFV